MPVPLTRWSERHHLPPSADDARRVARGRRQPTRAGARDGPAGSVLEALGELIERHVGADEPR
ncbi:MAG: hypothetical protein ACLP50_37180, partial [Solirubrobacteraceae bacterium]